jgi:uncharacterized RDD family membrane protein YckC
MRGQLRAGLAAMACLAVLVGSLPLLFSLVPQDPGPGLPSRQTVMWLVLGIAVYPVMLVIAHRYVRRAERNERAYADLVER